tara:strand:+ start:3644 stop:5041 length:1398 start_codon:yes stop_codon:yes gene_type:complete
VRKLHLYLIKSFLPPFIATFFIAIFVLFMQFLWKWVDELIGKGLEIDIILKFIIYAATRLVPLALPIAMLIASIMTYGKLAERNELSALKSSGISLIRIMIPLFIFSVIISILSFNYSNYILPVANLKSGTLIYDIQKKKPAINIREGEFYNEIDGYTIKVSKKDYLSSMMYDIIIYDHTSEQSNDKVIVSDSAEMKITDNEQYLELKLYNGSSYIEIYNKDRLKNYGHQRINFKENTIRFDLKKFGLKRSDENIYKNHYSMMNIKQLSYSIDSLEKKLEDKEEYYSNNYTDKFNLKLSSVNGTLLKNSNTYRNKKEKMDYAINKVRSIKSILKSNSDDLNHKKSIINRHKIEWHRKFSLSFACIILFVIGASLGSIIKKGGFGIPILVSILLFILYHILNITGEKQVKEVGLNPLIGMWLANLVFTPVSLILLYKATTDSPLLDFSYYKQTINNLFNRGKLNKS